MTRTSCLLLALLTVASTAAAAKADDPPWVVGIEELHRLDLLPAFKRSVKIGAVTSYDRTEGNDDGFSGKYSFVAKEDDGSLVWRSGVEGEAYESLRGPFKLDGKPVLFDDLGPLDTPITGNKRVMVHPETEDAWLVAYMPAAELELEQAWHVLGGLCEGVGVEAEPYA